MKKYNRRKILITLLIVTIVFSVIPVMGFALTEKSSNATGSLVLEAKGAVVICGTTGEMIYGKNKDEKLEPASMTKMLTALIVAENLDLNTVVTIDKETANTSGSTMGLKEGEKITVKSLLYGALLKSANDSAVALAKAVAGSVGNFAKMMNARAIELGAVNSNFVTPNGLPDKEHYSTAYDMALISRAAFSNAIIRKISGTTKYTMPATNMSAKRTVYSGNKLLYSSDKILIDGKERTLKYDGVFAGKTGSLATDNCSMAVAYKKNNVEFYAVVIGDTYNNRFADAIKVLDYGIKNVSLYEVFESGKDFGNIKVKGGAKTKVAVASETAGYAYLPKEASKSLISTKVVFDSNIAAPVKKSEVVGTVEIYLADEKEGEVNLIATKSVSKGWFTSSIGISNFGAVIIGFLLGFIFLVIIIIMGLRLKNKKKRRKLRQQKIMELAMEKEREENDYKTRDWRF